MTVKHNCELSIYTKVVQQSATCFDLSSRHLQAVIFIRI